jgi:hypothetical protein
MVEVAQAVPSCSSPQVPCTASCAGRKSFATEAAAVGGSYGSEFVGGLCRVQGASLARSLASRRIRSEESRKSTSVQNTGHVPGGSPSLPPGHQAIA